MTLVRQPVTRHPLRLHRWQDVEGMVGFLGIARQCVRCHIVEVYFPLTNLRYRGPHTMLTSKER